MSTKQSSRLTLADLLDRISGADMPPKLKADMSSAVRKVAAVLGADPGLIPVDPANLRRRLEGAELGLEFPQSVGLLRVDGLLLLEARDGGSLDVHQLVDERLPIEAGGES